MKIKNEIKIMDEIKTKMLKNEDQGEDQE